jgi:hypothetical protein
VKLVFIENTLPPLLFVVIPVRLFAHSSPILAACGTQSQLCDFAVRCKACTETIRIGRLDYQGQLNVELFLHDEWVTRKPADVGDEVAFALTYDTSNLDELPRRSDGELRRTLVEAAAIVRSIRFSNDFQADVEAFRKLWTWCGPLVRTFSC